MVNCVNIANESSKKWPLDLETWRRLTLTRLYWEYRNVGDIGNTE